MKRYTNWNLTVAICIFFIGCHSTQTVAQVKSSSHGTTIQWVTPKIKVPRLQYRIFNSAAAKSKVSYHIYTPKRYDTEKKRRFPVLFWLHGHGGGGKGIPYLVKYFDNAIRAGKMPPVIIVFPNGLFESMWCDSKSGKVRMETVVVKELVSHIDATFRTIASREARLIEGFSMGGYGAARLGFKYHDTFGAVSMLGAGPLQREFSPSIGPPQNASSRARILRNVYGNDQEYFRAQSPWVLGEQNKDTLRGKTRVRIAIGEHDGTLQFNRDFDSHLTDLQIPHAFRVVPDVGHRTMALLSALGDSNWEFYRTVFGAAGDRPR